VATKTERIEARVAPEEREQIERAANLTGVSTSAFMVRSAVQHAEAVIASTTTTFVPSDYFDELLAALDTSARAPRLAAAAKRARRDRRVRLA
jgi:uncharacterized protein (DUF1778 family)